MTGEMTDPGDGDLVLEKRRMLQKRRMTLMQLPPGTALNRILDDPEATALVHSYPEQDFYHLVQDVGVTDALDLLALASDRQWEFILDMEIWERDRPSHADLTRWLAILMISNPDRTVRWLMNEKSDLVQYYLYRSIDLVIREHDQDPSDLGEDFFTDDDVFYVRLKTPDRDVSQMSEAEKEERLEYEHLMMEMLRRFSAYDHVRYQQMLMEAAMVLPAEYEEEAYRLRNVRLAEKGFAPFDNALGVYRPLERVDLKRSPRIRWKRQPSAERALMMPIYPAAMLSREHLFVRALDRCGTGDMFWDVQSEFAALCNQVISADQRQIRERDALKAVVRKVCGYVSMGLELVGRHRDGDDLEGRAARLLHAYPVKDLFRMGFTESLRLKWRAQRWYQESWTEQTQTPLSFWDERGLGVMGGLMLDKPLYFDNYRSGVLYREFRLLDEVAETRRELERVIRLDRLFLALHHHLDLAQQANQFVTWKSVLLTLWAREVLGLDPLLIPIDLDRFHSFYRTLWRAEGRARIRDAVRTAFLDWVAKTAEMDLHALSADYGTLFEELFNELEQEYGDVSGETLDARFMRHFLIS